MVNVWSTPSSRCFPMLTDTTDGDRILRTRSRQASRCDARRHSSSQLADLGASMSRSPACGVSYITCTARFMSLPSSIRRMCPNHWSLRARIHISRSNVLDPSDASSFCVLPVITLNIRLFAPLSALWTSVVRRQASDPYVITEHTLEIYSRSLRLRWRALAFHRCRILP